MLRNVAAVVLDGVEPFELGVVCEVFGTDRSDDGLPVYDFAVVAGEPGPLRTSQGFTLSTPHGLDRLAAADLIAVPALSGPRVTRPSQLPAPLLAELRRGVDRGARVLSVCNGAFVLGAAGLLDDRRCTTHWHQTDTLARLFPAAKVDPDVLYVDDDPVFTSAGTAAGIDACLYLVRKEHGSKVANAIARRMVVPPHRDGGQAQYVDRPVAGSEVDTLKDVMSWLVRHLELPVTVDDLARRRGDVTADVRPPVRPGDRHHPAALADQPADPARPGAAGGDRRDDRGGGGPVRLRQRDRAAPPLPDLAVDHPAGLPPPVPRALLAGELAGRYERCLPSSLPRRSFVAPHRSSGKQRRGPALAGRLAGGWLAGVSAGARTRPAAAAPRRPVPSGSAPGPR